MPRKPPMWKRRVVIPGRGALVEGHIRFSDENQRDTLTLDSQKRVILEYCAGRGWVVVSWSIEDSVSGGAETLEARPKWTEHVAKIGKEVQVSVAIDLYRWSRDPGSIYESLRRIREQGGYWITCDDQHALDRIESDSGAQFGLAVSAVTAKQQLSATSARTHMGKVTRARMGLHNGPVMFGYKRQPIPLPPPGFDRMTYRVTERLPVIPDDHEIAPAHMTRFDALVKMGELRADGYSWGQIAIWLNERGITPTFRQNHKKRLTSNFTIVAVQNILGSDFPREFVRADGVPSGHGTVHDPDTNKGLEGLHKSAWDAGLCSRIDAVNVNHSEYRAASRITLTDRKRTGYYSTIARPYSGLLICAACNSPLHIHTTRTYQDTAHRLKVYCPQGGGGNIDEVNLDADIHWLLHVAIHENQQRQIAQSAQRYVVHKPQEVNLVNVPRIAALKAERERWTHLYAKGLITDEEVTEQLGKIKHEMQQLQTPLKPSKSVTSESILAAGQQWIEISQLWEEMTAAQRGKMLSFMFGPRSIAVDLHDRAIVRVRPKPPFDTILAAILESQPDSEGWLSLPLPDVTQHASVVARFGIQHGIKLSPRMLGISHRGNWHIPANLIERMRELRQQGFGYKYIATECKVSLDTVRKYTEGYEKADYE